MAKAPNFPITIKAGSTAIKIYRSPLQPGKRASIGEVSPVKSYDSYVVSYYQGGQRNRQRFNTLEAARTEADRIRALVMNEDLSALQITGEDRMVYVRANEVAKQVNLSLDILAKEYVQARSLLGSVTLIEAAQFYERHGKPVRERKTVPEVVTELLEGLQADNRSEYHLRDMKRRLRIFAEAFPGLILEVKTKDITNWLRGMTWVNSNETVKELAPKSRNHYRNAVHQLFSFARDHGYLPRGLPTEAEAVKTLDVVASENEIFTVEEMKTLLKDAKPELIPPLT